MGGGEIQTSWKLECCYIENYSESLSVAAAIASTTPSLCAQRNPLQVIPPPSSALQTVTPSAVWSASPQTTTPPGCSTPVITKSSSSLADSDSELEHFLQKGCGCKRPVGDLATHFLARNIILYKISGFYYCTVLCNKWGIASFTCFLSFLFFSLHSV